MPFRAVGCSCPRELVTGQRSFEKKDTPIEGRITAVADVYDALSSARPYKKAFSRDKCFRILKEGRGSHFDPNVLDAFFRRTDDITEIQLRFSDRA